ncbi:MAG: phosphoethanolamine--lipid A transferase [Piscinibacter sp.]|nr:phosphoethanolamine--lipid A transferase [Piscinibacter sp.]
MEHALPGTPARLRRWITGPIELSTETLVLAASLFWALSANRAFFAGALRDRSWDDPTAWGLAIALFALVVALHAALLVLLAWRHTAKPAVALLTLVSAFATYYTGAYGVVLDPSMLRNVLHTNPAEAGELLTPALFIHLLLWAGLPLLLLSRVQLVRRPWPAAAARRIGLLVAAVLVLATALLAMFQPFASLMRNHRDLRYQITPANVLWSTASVVGAEARGAARPRQPIGEDAAPGASWAQRSRPLVVLVVIGETARAADWGLSGAARQTTPELAGLPVVNFTQASSCGTNTEVSVPCMFAPVGRRDYDEARIRGQQSLLHVLARAGVAVQWRDNQSGCKGVCDGLPNDSVAALNPPGLCSDGRCLDEGLVADLDKRLGNAKGTQFWVLHMLGNHGPSYFRRYPPAFAKFQPECRDDDLRRCSIEQIRNSYDNALLYTDHVLARAIRTLRAQSDRVDSALLYVSDHGESLGEQGLFLHGLPYAIAPEVQTHVPMVMWTSPGLERATGLAPGCLQPELQRRARAPVSHDHLFHTVLGLLDVRTALHDPAWDLTQACRTAAAS